MAVDCILFMLQIQSLIEYVEDVSTKIWRYLSEGPEICNIIAVQVVWVLLGGWWRQLLPWSSDFHWAGFFVRCEHTN